MKFNQQTMVSFAIVIAFIAGVCYLTSRNISNNEDLLKISSTGGMCAGGPCSSALVVRNDGTYTFTGTSGEESNGSFSLVEVNELKSIIKGIDFAKIKSKPFTEICPIAYDGQQFTFTFYSENEVLDSCATAIDYKLPLFERLGAMLLQVYSQ